MAIKKARYGKDTYYDVKVVEGMPTDKIIIALHSMSATAYLIRTDRVNNQDPSKTTYVGYPISGLEKANYTSKIYGTAEEILTKGELEILLLDSLQDISTIESAYCYS